MLSKSEQVWLLSELRYTEAARPDVELVHRLNFSSCSEYNRYGLNRFVSHRTSERFSYWQSESKWIVSPAYTFELFSNLEWSSL